MGVNKLHLGMGQTLMPINVSFFPDEHARHLKHLCAIQPGAIRGHEGTGARLLRCAFFYDSHGYVLHRSLAESIVVAQRTLVEHDGDGRRRCVDPWDSESEITSLGRCASDPGLLFDFFKQCQRHARRTNQRARRNTTVQCVGASLGGAHTPWSLKHGTFAYFRQPKGTAFHGDHFVAVDRLVKAIAAKRDALVAEGKVPRGSAPGQVAKRVPGMM